MYKKIFLFLTSIFGVKSEVKELHKPTDVVHWGYSDAADMVYEVYVTNLNKNYTNGSFGFWVLHEKEDVAYKIALKRTISRLAWSYKTRFKDIW